MLTSAYKRCDWPSFDACSLPSEKQRPDHYLRKGEGDLIKAKGAAMATTQAAQVTGCPAYNALLGTECFSARPGVQAAQEDYSQLPTLLCSPSAAQRSAVATTG